jgi:hypothetical protein
VSDCLRAMAAGRTNIMGRTSDQVAVHKERYIVPLSLNVSKLSGVGEDTLFIGIMEVRTQWCPHPSGSCRLLSICHAPSASVC